MSDQEFSLLDLFREEARSHTATLSQGLVELEGDAANPRKIEPLMRAAHSLKGAARIIGINGAVGLAHAMEDAFVAAQHGRIQLHPADIDILLRGSDLLASLADIREADVARWGGDLPELAELIQQYERMARGETPQPASQPEPVLAAPPPAAQPTATPAAEPLPASAVPLEPIVPGEENPLFDLFREELRTGTLLVQSRLGQLTNGASEELFDELIRDVRSIKGAARIVSFDPAVGLAGRFEELLSALRQARGKLDAQGVGLLAGATTLLAGLIPHDPEGATAWVAAHQPQWQQAETQLQALAQVAAAAQPPAVAPAPASAAAPAAGAPAANTMVEAPTPAAGRPAPPRREVAHAARMPVGPATAEAVQPALPAPEEARAAPQAEPEAVVRVTAQSLNRLMSLAGESLVQARWLQPFSMALLKLKKQQDHLAGLLGNLGQTLSLAPRGGTPESIAGLVEEARQQVELCRQVLAERAVEFEDHAAAAEDLNSRLYREVIVSRMRPFSDGAHGFPRMVRDMARRLDKQVRLDINGLTTEVDRDILEKLEAPLMHLIRNGVDHGIEPPAERTAAGKPEVGVITVEVRHRAGMLAITVGDDGRGIDLDRLRAKVVERRLTSAEMASGMSEQELLAFLFLPGFTTTEQVTEFSGRGVGLDVVQDTIRKIGGAVRISSRRGRGTTFHLQLPITLSVLRAVLVDIAGEPYAFPHTRIDRLLRVPRPSIRSVEHRQFITVDGQNVGLVIAAQLLDLEAGPIPEGELPVLLLSDASGQYGLLVEAFRGEQDLVVRPLDHRLGKVPNVAAAAILDDGMPVLIADVEDLIRSMDHFIQAGSLRRCDPQPREERRKKRVLVVDDSITVREVERQLLRNAGYVVDVAVDGQDGLHHVQVGSFDLLVSDIDMPRMTGLELVRAVRNLEATRNLPIIIISYKDREEDRLRGLELGANYYLTKSSFHDNTFLRAVTDLIGEP